MDNHEDGIVVITDGERLYKILSQKDGSQAESWHKIVSKVCADGTIELASIIQTDDNKQVNKIITTFAQVEQKIQEAISLVGHSATTVDYNVLDFSDIEDVAEQFRLIAENPDFFFQWDTTQEEPRKVKINNVFLLEN